VTAIVRFRLAPRTALGTPLVGDTLFGHLCWALRERYGEPELDRMLDGYCAGRPGLVVSDAFPADSLPRPTVPDAPLGIRPDPAHRKAARTAVWLPSAGAGRALVDWLRDAQAADLHRTGVVTQNTINRYTGTTGTGQFAPRQAGVLTYAQGAELDLYVVVDTTRVSADRVQELLCDVGAAGYGRDATTGLGKFDVIARVAHTWPITQSRTWLTLAPCAPDTMLLDAEHCFYAPVTRFGRHGSIAARTGQPFKRPILAMRTGALLRTRSVIAAGWLGRGIGGRDKPLSSLIPATVHQGYAPVVPIDDRGMP
jgi:CRISPR-associated protein Csm4